MIHMIIIILLSDFKVVVVVVAIMVGTHIFVLGLSLPVFKVLLFKFFSQVWGARP